MSWRTVNWANEQRTSSTGTQLVLLQLANWATPEGDIRVVGVEALAALCLQSERSIFRRLAELETAGIFTRQVIGRHENGARLVSGKLHLEKSYRCDSGPEGEGVAANLSATPADRVAVTPDDSVAVGGGVADTPVSYPAATAVSYPYKKDSTRQDSKPESPPPPPVAAAEPAKESEEEKFENRELEFQKRLEADFAEFRKAYPFDHVMSVANAREELGELNLTDRKLATRNAAKYAEALKKNKRDFATHAANWLKRREFDRVAETEQIQAEQAGLAKPLVFVQFMTPGWDAWAAHHGRHGTKMPPAASRHLGKSGWWFETLFPPKSTDPPAPPIAEDRIDF